MLHATRAPRLALLLLLSLAACEPTEDPAAADGQPPDSAMETDGGEADGAPDPEPDGAPDPTPDTGPAPDGGPDAAPAVDGGADAGPVVDAAPEVDAAPDMAPPAVCGDGEIEGDEECDDGPDNSDELADACRTDCRPARCGDGVVDGGEVCDGGRTCDADLCLPACADECEQGAIDCDGGVIVCDDHDDDPCFEWSPPDPCAEDEACVEGACVCVDTCPADAAECVGEGAVRMCAPQADGCLGWGPGEACGEFEACVDAACAPLPPPPVVINEVLYDAPGADAPRVFIELWGPPGTPLDGLVVRGINGNGGGETGAIALQGVIADDGFHVIAHTDAEPALAALADQLHRAVDLQNGPDSVQLVRGELVVDALGYGEFGDEVYAGEGEPAPDVTELSLTRDAEHTDTDDNFTDFTAAEPSPRGDPPVCIDACAANDIRCMGDAIESCVAGPDGCLVWQVDADCGAEGLQCVDGACVCLDACEADAMRCVEDAIESCVAGPDGCLGWQVGADCAADGQVCIDGACACADVCEADAMRCVGDAIERCAPVDDCLEWVAEVDCAADGGLCRDGACEAPPRCGDGVVDEGEACDDGNVELGDGCDDACAEEDPFDQRAILMLRAPPPGERPDHVPDGPMAYAPGLSYDNDHYYVFEAFDDSIREQVARVPIGRGLRLVPGDYAVVINDTFSRVVVDWLDRVEIRAGRLEVRSREPGTYTVRPPRRFDDIARDLPLRGCGQFGNQVRSPWLFSGCDGDIGGGAFDLDRGLVVLPHTYRVGVDATYHSPNETFVEVPPGEVGVYAPADTRSRIELLPSAGELPDFELDPMPSYGTSDRRVRSGNGGWHVFRFLGAGQGYAFITSGFDAPAVVPAGRYYVTLNDTFTVRDVAVGDTLRVPTGRIEVPGEGTFDIDPGPDVPRFTYLDNQRNCSRDGPESYLLASCAVAADGGVFPRGTGVRVLPGSYRVRIYDDAGELLQVQVVEVPDAPPE